MTKIVEKHGRDDIKLRGLRGIVVSGLLLLATFCILTLISLDHQFRIVRLVSNQNHQLGNLLELIDHSDRLLMQLLSPHLQADEVELLGRAENFYLSFYSFIDSAKKLDNLSDISLAREAEPMVNDLRDGIVDAVALYRVGDYDEFRLRYTGEISKLLHSVRQFIDDARFEKSYTLRDHYARIELIETRLKWVSAVISIGLVVIFLLAFKHFESIIDNYVARLKIRNELVRKVEKEKLTMSGLIQMQLESANSELEIVVAHKTQSLKEAIENYKRVNEKLEFYNTQDPLTKLYNRGYFDKQYGTELRRAQGTGMTISVMMIDIDKFKNINDTHGHMVGDECIRQVAKMLRHIIKRETDVVARYGGEEFVALLPGVSEKEGELIAEKIRQQIESRVINAEGIEIQLTVSIGLASMVPLPELTTTELLKRADDALYAAKQGGRNRVEFDHAA